MQSTKVRNQQPNLATRRQEADSRSVASRRSDFKRKRKLSYNNVVEKKNNNASRSVDRKHERDTKSTSPRKKKKKNNTNRDINNCNGTKTNGNASRIATGRSDRMCRRKLGYINEGDDNVDKKKKKNNNRNNNDSNDEIKAIEVEKKKLTNALADLYSRCKNSTDTYHLQFNPSLYGCFVDKYIEDKLKVGSTLRRIVEILLDNPRRSWKCIDTNSLIFNNDEVKWLNSSLNKKKINQEVKSVFKQYA